MRKYIKLLKAPRNSREDPGSRSQRSKGLAKLFPGCEWEFRDVMENKEEREAERKGESLVKNTPKHSRLL